ncbi:J domain-containing protein [Spirosoma knui]
MPSSQLVRILSSASNQAPLSKYQKAFNRLTEQISQLDEELATIRQLAQTVQERIMAKYEPLLATYNQHRARLVRLYDRAHDRPETSRPEQRKLAGLIRELAEELIRQHGLDELQPILDKYTHAGSDRRKKTSERIDRYTYSEESQSEQKTSAESAETHFTSARQQKREARIQAEEQNSTKAVRTLYVDLVKAFHPDWEPNEAEKLRKTTIMQRVTEAYEKSNLLALLQLQLELDHIDERHLEKLADNQLRYYNAILQQQVDELTQTLAESTNRLERLLGKPVPAGTSMTQLEQSLNADINTLKKSTKSLRNLVKTLTDPVQLKAWLRAQAG